MRLCCTNRGTKKGTFISDPRYGNNFIDANFFDRTGEPEDAAVDMILRLQEEGALTLLLPYSVKAEIEHPNTPAGVKRRALKLHYSIPVQLTAPELGTRHRIRALIRGNAQPGQHDEDAFHLVESAKYGGRYFVTNDRRLLDKAPEIWEILLIKTIKPSDFLAAYFAHANGGPCMNQL